MSLFNVLVRASASSLKRQPVLGLSSTVVPLSISHFSTLPILRQQQQQQQQQIPELMEQRTPGLHRHTVKPILSRKTYLVDVYKYFYENNDIVLIAHHNNMLASDNEKVRQQLLDAGAEFRKVRAGVFRHYLRASQHPDPASKAAFRQVKRKRIRHPMEPLIKGPSALILIKTVDPSVVKNVLNVLKQQKEKLFLVGGRVGKDVMDLDKLTEFKDLPTLPELQSQLAGILTMLSGAGLVQTLESTGSALYLNLDAHKQEMEKPEGGEEKKDE